MSQLLVRDVDTRTVERLKRRARENGRSLQRELREILENAARPSFAEARAATARIRRRLAGRRFAESASLIREDRRR
jgi:antitoxin FitA